MKQWVTKFLVLASALFTAAGYAVPAQKVDQQDPYQMMREVAEKTFERLKSEQDVVREQPEQLKVIVEEELMPYVNYRYAALKLLGSHLKKADKKEVGQFIEAFRSYLVTTYAQVLTQYRDQEVLFAPERKVDEQDRIISIAVEIVDKPNPNIKLDFKLRKDKKSGDWAAFDMVAEGVSLLSSKRSEWNGKIRQQGIASVAGELQELAQQPIVFKER